MMSGLKPGFGKLATIDEAFEILYSNLPVLEPQTVTLREALHRVTASDVVSGIDVPHFSRSAMDGYAVRASDTYGASESAPKVFDVISDQRVVDGACIEVGTGAPLPEGADGVVMVEYTENEVVGQVTVRKSIAPRENVIEKGSDIIAQSTVIHKGTLIEPRHLGVLAAVGQMIVEVVRRPLVALLSTGREVTSVGDELPAEGIYDINTHTLRGALEVDGCEVVDFGIVADETDLLEQTVREAFSSSDIVLASGGSSLGRGDLVTEVFERVGKLLLYGVAVKPGKPLALGLARDQGRDKLLVGLPGYPMSALSDYYIFVRPYLRRAMGLAPDVRLKDATLSRKHPSTVGRYEFLPVRLDGDVATPISKGSSSVTAMAEADGFVEIDTNIEVIEKGRRVKVRLF